MKSKPLVSIVTPSFNQAKFLESSILSVLHQGYQNLEYIIVDGGSTDGSLEIIQKYENRLAWWVSEKDKGQADAFNKGLSHASGKYLGWLNSDDLYIENAISEAVDLLESNTDLAFVYGDVQSINQVGAITNIMRYSDWDLLDLMRFNIIGQPGVFMRKDLVDSVGGLDTSFHFLLDHHLWLKLASKAPIKYSDKLWAAARFHLEAKNIAQAEKFGQEAYRLVEWMEKNPDLNQLFIDHSNQIIAGAHRMDARYLLDGERYAESVKTYWQGMKLDFMTIFPEIHRMMYAIFAPIGLKKLKQIFLKLKFLVKRPDLKGK